MSSPTPRKRLTPDERDRIIELKLNRVPVRTIADQVGTTTRTVQQTWTRWLQETAAERAGALEQTRSEVLARLDRIATDARLGAIRARRDNDDSAVARYLSVEQSAIVAAGKLQGLEVTKVEHSGVVGVAQVTIVEEIVDALPDPALEEAEVVE